ncbi:unnamed protein product [Caenorhabditis nigoni]
MDPIGGSLTSEQRPTQVTTSFNLGITEMVWHQLTIFFSVSASLKMMKCYHNKTWLIYVFATSLRNIFNSFKIVRRPSNLVLEQSSSTASSKSSGLSSRLSPGSSSVLPKGPSKLVLLAWLESTIFKDHLLLSSHRLDRRCVPTDHRFISRDEMSDGGRRNVRRLIKSSPGGTFLPDIKLRLAQILNIQGSRAIS